jgi:hypothetical protein
LLLDRVSLLWVFLSGWVQPKIDIDM